MLAFIIACIALKFINSNISLILLLQYDFHALLLKSLLLLFQLQALLQLSQPLSTHLFLQQIMWLLLVHQQSDVQLHVFPIFIVLKVHFWFFVRDGEVGDHPAVQGHQDQLEDSPQFSQH